MDLKLYEHMARDDPKKTHKYLLDMIERRVKANKEEKNWENKEKSIKDHRLTPALTAPKGKKEKDEVKPQTEAKTKKEAAAPVMPEKRGRSKFKDNKAGRGRSGDRNRSQSPGAAKKIPCKFYFHQGKCTKGTDCRFSHQKSAYTDDWKKKYERGVQRSNSPSASKGKCDKKICTYWLKGKCTRGKDCKYKHGSDSAPAETGSDKGSASSAGSDAGSEKKKESKKKGKAMPVIAASSLWEDSESEAESECSWEEIVDSDAETECSPATPETKIWTKKGSTRRRSVTFLGWVEFDDGDIGNQFFPERDYSDYQDVTGVSTEKAKEIQYK